MSAIGSDIRISRTLNQVLTESAKFNESDSHGALGGYSVARADISPHLSRQHSSQSVVTLLSPQQFAQVKLVEDDVQAEALEDPQIEEFDDNLEDSVPDGKLTRDDIKGFVETQFDGAHEFLKNLEKKLAVPADQFIGNAKKALDGLKSEVLSERLPKADQGKSEIKKDLEGITKSIRKELESFQKEFNKLTNQNLGSKTVSAYIKVALSENRQNTLIDNNKEWRDGYEVIVGGKSNQFTPLGDPKTCHHHTTDHPTNAWKTTFGNSRGGVTFYRNGTFAPQPSKVGESWDKATKQDSANKRAEKMAKHMASDYFNNNISEDKLKEPLTFTFSNLNAMRQTKAFGETKLTDLHSAALNHVNGQTLQIKINGKTHDVRIQTREWQQDIKDAQYLGNSKAARQANESALKSLQADIDKLPQSKERKELKELSKRIGDQLTLQNRSGFRRLFDAIGRGIANKFSTVKRENPLMDASELSAIIIVAESKLAQHQPGGISEGCKSGKDRGSLVDVATKALSLQLPNLEDSADGKSHLDFLKPGWMLKAVNENVTFRAEVGHLFTSNYKLQEVNTGFKGYITSDILSWTGHQNYMESVAMACVEGGIRGGSAFIKS